MANGIPPKLEFDIKSATEAGLNSEDIARHVSNRRGYDYEGAKKAGLTDDDIIAYNVANVRDIGRLRAFGEEAGLTAATTAPASMFGIKQGFRAGMALPIPNPFAKLAAGLIGGIVGGGIGAVVGEYGKEKIKEAADLEGQLTPSRRPFQVAGETFGFASSIGVPTVARSATAKIAGKVGGPKYMAYAQRPDFGAKAFMESAANNPGMTAAMKKIFGEGLEAVENKARRDMQGALNRPITTAISDVAMATGAATGAGIAEEIDPGDLGSRLTGELTLSVLNPYSFLLNRGSQYVGAAINKFRKGEERDLIRAAQGLAKAAAEMPEDMRPNFDKLVDELLAELSPEEKEIMNLARKKVSDKTKQVDLYNAAEKTNDSFLRALQEVVMARDPTARARILQRAKEGSSAVARMIDTLMDSMDPDVLSDASKLQNSYFKESLETLLNVYAARAMERAGKLSAVSDAEKAEAGQMIVNTIEQSLAKAREIESKLYGEVSKTIEIKPENIIKAYFRELDPAQGGLPEKAFTLDPVVRGFIRRIAPELDDTQVEQLGVMQQKLNELRVKRPFDFDTDQEDLLPAIDELRGVFQTVFGEAPKTTDDAFRLLNTLDTDKKMSAFVNTLAERQKQLRAIASKPTSEMRANRRVELERQLRTTETKIKIKDLFERRSRLTIPARRGTWQEQLAWESMMDDPSKIYNVLNREMADAFRLELEKQRDALSAVKLTAPGKKLLETIETDIARLNKADARDLDEFFGRGFNVPERINRNLDGAYTNQTILRVAESVPKDALNTGTIGQFNKGATFLRNYAKQAMSANRARNEIETAVAKGAAGEVGNITIGELMSFRSHVLGMARKSRTDPNAAVNAGFYSALSNAALEDIGTRSLQNMSRGEKISMAMRDPERFKSLKALNAAYGFSKELNDVFTRGFGGQYVATTATGAERIIPELAGEKLRAGSSLATSLRMKELDDAVDFVIANVPRAEKKLFRDLKGTMRGAEEVIIRGMARDSSIVNPTTGEVNVTALNNFLKREGEMIKQRFPELYNDLQDAGTAQVIFASRREMGTLADKHLDQIGSFKTFLKSENPSQEIDRLIGVPGVNPNKRAQANLVGLIKFVDRAKDPNVKEGLKQVIYDAAWRHAGGNTEQGVDFFALRRYLMGDISRGNPSVLKIMQERGLLSEQEVKNWNAMLTAADRFQKTLNGGDAAAINRELVEEPSFLGAFIARVIGAKGASGALKAFGLKGGDIQTPGAGAALMNKLANKLPYGRTWEYLANATQDPLKMSLLLKRVKNESEILQTYGRLKSPLRSVGGRALTDMLERSDYKGPATAAMQPTTQDFEQRPRPAVPAPSVSPPASAPVATNRPYPPAQNPQQGQSFSESRARFAQLYPFDITSDVIRGQA